MLSHQGKPLNRTGTPILEVDELQVEARVNQVSFKLYPGEVLGLAGLMGSGRTELVRAIFGLDKKDSGKLRIDGAEVKIRYPIDAMNNGIAFIPEDIS